MENIKEILINLRENDKYQRVDVTNPVAWYVGLDEYSRYSLFVITETQPLALVSTKIINLFIGKQTRWKVRYYILFDREEKYRSFHTFLRGYDFLYS